MATTNSSIQWTDATWNPVRGCSIVSPGCTNCYAMKQAHRFSGPGQPYEGLTRLVERGPIWTGKVRLVPEALDQPLRWRRPRRIFVNSMSDLFHEDVEFSFIAKVFDVMWRAKQHVFQILTKRPARMLEFHKWMTKSDVLLLPNVWLGVSIEDQARAKERIPLLLQTPAAVRFLSVEPLLESVKFDPAWLRSYRGSPVVNWVIVGGESGPSARACNVGWIRSIVEQCKVSGVRCFVKQVGSRPFIEGPVARDKTWPGLLRDRKGGDPAEWPEDLRVQEYPA